MGVSKAIETIRKSYRTDEHYKKLLFHLFALILSHTCSKNKIMYIHLCFTCFFFSCQTKTICRIFVKLFFKSHKFCLKCLKITESTWWEYRQHRFYHFVNHLTHAQKWFGFFYLHFVVQQIQIQIDNLFSTQIQNKMKREKKTIGTKFGPDNIFFFFL